MAEDQSTIQGTLWGEDEPTNQQKEIAAFYQASGNRTTTCTHFHCGRPVLVEALNACGVLMKKPSTGRGRRKSQAFYEKLAADYVIHRNIEEVTRLNECSRTSVYFSLRLHGIKASRLRHEPPPPFPDSIDRQRFGDWLSGFVDGEGHFHLGWNRQFRFPIPFVCFDIGLRDDDQSILQQIRSYFGSGWLRTDSPGNKDGCLNRKPRCVYRIDSVKPLALQVVPHFEQHPLRAKKSRDFSIWQEAILLCHTVACRGRRGRPWGERQWQQHELDRYESLYIAIKQQRLYVPQPPQPKACLTNPP